MEAAHWRSSLPANQMAGSLRRRFVLPQEFREFSMPAAFGPCERCRPRFVIRQIGGRTA